MAGGPHTRLARLSNAQDSTLSNILLDNFISLYDWGFLDRGQFYNIDIPESGIYGGDKHKLRLAEDPNYLDGQVWEGYRQNWVWESPARSMQGYQLGGGQWINSDVVFYVISENHWECTNLMDSILYQNDRTVHLFNPTAVAISGVFPFNYRNELNENAIPSGLYPNMIDDFYYNRCWISESRGSEISQLSPDLYVGSTRCSTQVKAI